MIPRLHLVTDDEILAREGFPEMATRAMTEGGGRLALHLRGPRTAGRTLHGLAETLSTRVGGALLLVNDRVDVALALGLAGAHLGQRSIPPSEARRLLGPRAVLGLSVHDEDEVRRASTGVLDYVVVGTVFPSPSHPGREPAGPETLERVGRLTSRPVLAIGGITPERVEEASRAGAHGVVVRGGVWNAPDPRAAVRVYLGELEP